MYWRQNFQIEISMSNQKHRTETADGGVWDAFSAPPYILLFHLLFQLLLWVWESLGAHVCVTSMCWRVSLKGEPLVSGRQERAQMWPPSVVWLCSSAVFLFVCLQVDGTLAAYGSWWYILPSWLTLCFCTWESLLNVNFLQASPHPGSPRHRLCFLGETQGLEI